MTATQLGDARLDSTTGTSVSPPLDVAPTANCYVLVAVDIGGDQTSEVSSVSAGTGTFVRATRRAGAADANMSVELWVGYNFGSSAPTSVAVTRTGPAGRRTNVATRVIDMGTPVTTAPTITESTGNESTSATYDSGLVTPAVDDLLFAGAAVNGTSPPNSRTYTGNTYTDAHNVTLGSPMLTTVWCQAANAVASKVVWNGSVSGSWVAQQVSISAAAPPPEVVTGAITLAASCTLALAPRKVNQGAITLAAASTLAVAPTKVNQGAITLATASTLALSPRTLDRPTLTLTSAGQLSLSGRVVRTGGLSLAGASALTCAGRKVLVGQLQLGAASGLALAGRVVQGATVRRPNTGTVERPVSGE